MFADASYSIQSQWLYSECTGKPDLIIGSTDIFATIPFTSLVSSGPGYCGNEWIQDCSYPGICTATLDLDLTNGYRSFQDSYLYFVPETPSKWLFPIGANNGNYCKVSSMNSTVLILAGSIVCYENFSCLSNITLAYSNDKACQEISKNYALGDYETGILVNNLDYNISKFSVASATEKVVWTTYISPSGTVILPGDPLWKLAVAIIAFSLLTNVLHGIKAVLQIKFHQNSRNLKYLVFTLGFLLNITENILVFYLYGEGTGNGGYYTLVYGLTSGLNVAMNGLCLMEIVFQTMWSRLLLALFMMVVYFLFGVPYVASLYFEFYCSTEFCGWLNGYFNSISYPLWQIFCFAFDPITAGTIIFYIIRKSLHELDEKLLQLFKIMFNDYRLVAITSISLLNFGTSVFLQLATSYSFFAGNDKIMTIYQTFFSLQHTVNSACTLWYYIYFPIVLARMKALRKTLKNNRKSVISDKTKQFRDSVVSSTQKMI
ncbi:hypothetical protein HDV04_003307 [Boothiomyces sp. JEL0838]|nr:hypothetical protein HDV04_003307 [Boothiomyces sp. JEL0838]